MKNSFPTRQATAFFPHLSLYRNLLLRRLGRIKQGCLTIRDGDKCLVMGDMNGNGIQATITVRNPSFYASTVLGGTIGAGESYMQGAWECDSLTKLIAIIIANRNVLVKMDQATAAFSMPLHLLLHKFRRNSLAGSKRNIREHYDLGNDFYKLFLDDTMTYSCGVFDAKHCSLEQASLNKYKLICRKLAVDSHDHVVEIGGGWGGFALYAAQNHGCRVTTTTISRRQYEYARQRIQQAGLEKRVRVLLADYRELAGKYDKLVSIEMLEAVGYQYYETFFASCQKLLTDNGAMLHQVIVINDQAHEYHKKSVDFIKRYIFPGCCIPSVTALLQALTKVTDMGLFHLEDITPHYVNTLQCWRRRFFRHLKEISQLGFTDEFIRMWEFYLCYCEAGFQERYLGNVQMVFTKPACRPRPIRTFDAITD